MSTPTPVAPLAPKSDPRGSLGLGIALAWAALIGGYAVVAFLAGALISLHGDEKNAVVIVLMFAPWLLMLGLIVWFATKNKPRTALGVLVGIASIIAVILLLVAACFGLFAVNR